LSAVPKVRIAKLLSHSGVASTTMAPTARIGDEARPNMPATSWAMPRATAPDRIPSAAPTAMRRSACAGGVAEVDGVIGRAVSRIFIRQ
jgi:hypothetical protein